MRKRSPQNPSRRDVLKAVLPAALAVNGMPRFGMVDLKDSDRWIELSQSRQVK